jgi:hypothetical protein
VEINILSAAIEVKTRRFLSRSDFIFILMGPQKTAFELGAFIRPGRFYITPGTGEFLDHRFWILVGRLLYLLAVCIKLYVCITVNMYAPKVLDPPSWSNSGGRRMYSLSAESHFTFAERVKHGQIVISSLRRLTHYFTLLQQNYRGWIWRRLTICSQVVCLHCLHDDIRLRSERN